MQRVSNAVREAIDGGLIDPLSTARCLVVSPEMLAKTGGRGGRSCRHHRIKARNSDVTGNSVHAQNFTGDVKSDLSNFTGDVKLVHGRREVLSVDRPISDLFLPGASAPDPDTKTDTSERKSA
jgi:hypothetical protein